MVKINEIEILKLKNGQDADKVKAFKGVRQYMTLTEQELLANSMGLRYNELEPPLSFGCDVYGDVIYEKSDLIKWLKWKLRQVDNIVLKGVVQSIIDKLEVD